MADGSWLMTDGSRRPPQRIERRSVSALLRGLRGSIRVVIRRERRHRERAGPVRIDAGGRAEAVLPHQRAEAREERRELFGRRLRAREERVLHARGPASDR